MSPSSLASLFLAAAIVQVVAAEAAGTRDRVLVVGSATLYPLAQEVAKRASQRPDGGDFDIRVTGIQTGIDEFCSGDGLQYPDILNASRRMREDDVELCRAHGVTSLVEVKVGYDGVTLAQAAKAPAMGLSAADLYLALAARVPDPQGRGGLVPNPYKSWHQVDPALPDRPIAVLGPAQESGTREAFAELALEAGCGLFAEVRQEAGRDRKKLAEICRTIRADGVYRRAVGDEDAELKALVDDPTLVGVMDYRLLESNKGLLTGIAVEGEAPTRNGIATGQYPLSRGLFVYYKKTKLEDLPAVSRYLSELTSEPAWGEQGYLPEVGLIPMMADERQKYGFIAEHRIDPACPPFCR